jgi:pimeloyl-ACP methyl ester carboxylesterase
MDLHYEVHGTGEAIVLIHCGGADIRNWQFIIPPLSQLYQVIALDGRGAGKSPPLIEAANYVEDLTKLLDKLGIDQAVIVGHSIGGQIATDFALHYPQKVSKLVLIAPGLTGFEFSPTYQQWTQQVMAAAPDVEKMVTLTLTSPMYRVVMSSPQRDFLIEMMKYNTQRALEWKTFDMIWPQPPAISRLSLLKTKTLLIIGKEDSEDLWRIAELFQQVPDIQFAYIEGADHLPTLTHPDETTTLITDFLRH